MAGALFREEDHAAIAAALATDETLREAVATYMATTAAITRANGGVAPVMVLPQLAPSPDYRTSEPAPEGPAQAPPCCYSCSRPLARFAGPGPESGWTCVVCDDPAEREPVEVCSCEEAVALRAQLAHLRRAHDTDAVTCREALDRVDELTAELAALRGRPAAANDLDERHRLIAWLERALAGEGLHVVTAADKAVLDAMAAMPDDVLVWAPKHAVSASLDEACRAEFARRGAAEPDRLTAAARRAFAKAETGAHWRVLATRTEAEQRVLDAVSNWVDGHSVIENLSAICLAELARREAAR